MWKSVFDELAFLLRSDSRENGASVVRGDVDRRLAYAPGTRMNQHALAFLQISVHKKSRYNLRKGASFS